MKKVMPLILGLFLTGCSVYHSNLPELPGQLPDKFVEAGDLDNFSEPGRFWERFNDQKLTELVTFGLAGNLDVKEAMARHSQFLALEKISNASALPFLSLSGSAGRDRQLSSSGASEGSTLKLAAVAGYEIDLWDKLASGRSTASYNTQASVADIKAAYISIAAQITDLYYLVVEQRAQLALNERVIASQADTLGRIESRYEAGLVAALDVYQARQNIIAAKTNRPVYQAGLAKANHALAVLLGRFPGPDLGTNIVELPATIPAVPAVLPSELISRRPDIEAALLRIRGLDKDIAAAVSDRFPSFNLSAAFGSAGLDYAGHISGTLWSLLLETTMPLFDYGKRKAEVERRQAVLEENLAQYHQTILTAFQEVEDALVAGRSGEEQIRALTELETAATATLRLAEEQYFEGLTDYLSVLTAQENHFAVQARLLSARKQLISDRISLMKALGGDWMAAEVNNRIEENGETR